jgi:hypothetical protein
LNRVILFYNSMWGGPLEYPPAEIPSPYVLTTDVNRVAEAVAVVFHLPTLPADTIPNGIAKRPGQVWVAWCMECEAHYPQLNNRALMSWFDMTMTYRLASDVPAPYLPPGLDMALRTGSGRKPDRNILNAFVSSPHDRSGRTEYLRQLMSRMEVHSYGKLFQNRRLDRDLWRETKLQTMGTYKFTVAFENAIAKDYVTEKFYDPLIVGSVPIYLGAPNIEDFAPGEHCFINAADWSPTALAEYLIDLAGNDAAYARYMEWKRQPFRERFNALLDLVKTHPFVRLCKKVEDRLSSQNSL